MAHKGAQQAAEKAVKAVYKSHGWEFRYTHDIGELLNGLQVNDLAIPEGVRGAIEPAEYA